MSMVAVLLYHGRVGGSGGFIAISQFFTLSGFLVTSLLLRESAAPGGLDVRRFWSRRFRRLLPAALLTLAGAVVFGATIASETQTEGLRTGVPAAVAQVANWHFIASETSYAALFTAPSPIQHFWSLAIEEQFYLAMPLVLIGFVKLSDRSRWLVGGLVVAILGSSGWMYHLFESGASIDRIYYGTDTRAAELLTGCLLAVLLQHHRPTLGPSARRALGGMGFLAYVTTGWAFFALSLTDPLLYRGGYLVVSILTCIVIYSLVEEVGVSRHALGFGPVAAFGRITYGVYLFHWPLMLTMTEQRIGLDGWSLFALQVTTTTVLATISARFVEAPFRRPGVVPARALVLGLGGAVGLLLAGSLTLQLRSVENDRAGLGESTAEQPGLSPDPGDPVTVIAIGDTTGLDVVANELVPALADSASVELVATSAFVCDRVDDGCAGHQQWLALVERHDPDVVLLHAREWEGFPSLGAGDLTERVRAMTDQLSAVFDVLTTRGATVVWSRGDATIAEAIRAETDPFFLAMFDLSSTRPDVRRSDAASDDERLIDDLMLFARRRATDAQRVLVVGDSVARTVGYGLEQQASAEGTALVWSAGVEGCGIAGGGVTLDASGREQQESAACVGLADEWERQIRSFDPDTVLVVSNAADFRTRRMDQWPTALGPGSPEFDRYLVDEYVHAYDTLSASGAEVVWAIPPCADDIFGAMNEPDGGNAVQIERIRHVARTILPALQRERPGVRLLDLYSIICPDDEPLFAVDGVVLRPDGVHFSVDGALWLADTIGREIMTGPGS